MGKWLDGWMVVKAVLRIAYSNQKQLSPGRVGRWMGGSKKNLRIAYSNQNRKCGSAYEGF